MRVDSLTPREKLLYERIGKLEGTLRAYDALLNTAAADRMRKRLRELESAIACVVDAGGLPEEEKQRIKVILGNKERPKY